MKKFVVTFLFCYFNLFRDQAVHKGFGLGEGGDYEAQMFI
jgi:hypothetical protein